jgi:hypothetical protein
MPTKRKTTKKDTSRADQLLARADQVAASAGIEIEPEPYSLEWYRAEWPARKRNFIEREIKIRNAFHRNALEPFILNDAQLELLEASNDAYFDSTIEDNTLKCRRLGISTYYCADYLADAIIESGHHVRIVAQDPSTLRALVNVVKTMYENLRQEIKPASKYNAKEELEFNDPEKGVINSRFSLSTVIPGQEEKGRGDTITRLHETEIPFWRGDAEMASTALEEAAKGGKVSRESTAKGVGDKFHREYKKGKKGEGGNRSHFFTWYWHREYQISGARFIFRPDDKGTSRTAGWHLLKPGQRFEKLTDEDIQKARVSDYTKEERQKQGQALQSEYDCAHDILNHLKRKGYVDASALWNCDEVAAFIAYRRMMVEKRGAKKFRVEYPENDIDPFAQTGGGIFSECPIEPNAQFRDAEPGHEYKLFLDPSNGVEEGDPYCITVQDCNTGEQVYEETGIKKQDFQAQSCCELSDKYNACEIGIESNMGEAAILEVERLGYEHRLYRHINPDTERDIRDGKISYSDALKQAKPGLPMTERTKRRIINKLEQAWRTGEFKCASQTMCDEAQVFIQIGEQMGAKSGHHDDTIMANACCRFLVETSRVGSSSFESSGDKLPSALLGGF